MAGEEPLLSLPGDAGTDAVRGDCCRPTVV
jgi:hypothetical protein